MADPEVCRCPEHLERLELVRRELVDLSRAIREQNQVLRRFPVAGARASRPAGVLPHGIPIAPPAVPPVATLAADLVRHAARGGHLGDFLLEFFDEHAPRGRPRRGRRRPG